MERRETISSAQEIPSSVVPSGNGESTLSSLPPSLYRDQNPVNRANSGIAELLVVIGVCAILAGTTAASIQGAVATDSDMGHFAGWLGLGAFWGVLVALIVSFFQSPRIVTIPVAIVFGPLVGTAVAATLVAPESYRTSVGLAAIGGAMVLGLVALVIGRLRGKRS